MSKPVVFLHERDLDHKPLLKPNHLVEFTLNNFLLMLKILLIWVCIAGLSVTVSAYGNVSGQVTSVIDGNTLEVTTEAKEVYKIILAGIDSPELTQEYGIEAKAYLEKIALNKAVVVEMVGKDRKGNNLGVVLVKGRHDLRIELLKQGLAWTAEKDPHPELEVYRSSAQEQGKGLWKESNPTPPWTFRRQQSMLQPKTS